MTSVRTPQAIVAGLFVAGLALYSTLSVHHDVAWLMYCGQRMFSGYRLYVDCVEVNPPLSFYLTLLPAYVAQRFDLPANLSLAVYVLALTALVVAMSVRIFRGAGSWDNWWMAAILTFALLFMPICNFGQREHFTVLLVLPYLFALAARMSGQPLSRRMAFAAGAMAGIGFSVKHYFLLVPLVMEIVLAVRRRSLKSVNRPEIYGAILAGLAHAGFVVAAHPEYFTQIAPMAIAAYNGYAVTYFILLTQPWFIVTVFALGYHVRVRAFAPKSMVADVLAIASAAFLAVYIAQDRGWQYHVLPSQILLMAASVILIVKTFLEGQFQWRGLQGYKRPLLAVAVTALAAQNLFFGVYTNAMPSVLSPLIDKYAANRTYYILSPTIATGFPLSLEQDLTWGSRFPFQWLVPGVVKGQRYRCSDKVAPVDVEDCARLAQINDYVLNAVVEDFERYQPDVVLVDLKTKDDPDFLYDNTSFDLLGYFVHGSPRFAEIWKHYELIEKINLTTKFTEKARVLELWVRRSETRVAPIQSSLGKADPGAAGTP